MEATVRVFNGTQYVGKTSYASNCVVTHELMRMYTLHFEIVNSNPIRPYINENSMFVVEGQKYDINHFEQESGFSNTTSIEANHVGYRLNNYTLAAGYAFVGTPRQIAQDMLDNAVDDNGNKASSEFAIGTMPDLGTISFSLGNDDIVTAKSAIMALKNIGAESDFDNFTINFAAEIGGGATETFAYGVNMQKLKITYDKSNGTTYEAAIVDLQKIPGHEGDVFDVGYYGKLIDILTGNEITKRIITYARCLDDPTQNTITLGVFVSDANTNTAQMQVQIDNSVQVGSAYNNCSITRKDGFVCVAGNNSTRVMQNATSGFIIQHSGDNGGTWADILTVDSSNGEITITSADGKSKVVLGVSGGYSAYILDDNGDWVLIAGSDMEGDSVATKFYNPKNPDFYGIIGSTPDNYSGLELFDKSSGEAKCFAKILEALGQAVSIFDGTQTTQAQISSDGVHFFKDGSEILSGLDGTARIPSGDGYAAYTLNIQGGRITSISS